MRVVQVRVFLEPTFVILEHDSSDHLSMHFLGRFIRLNGSTKRVSIDLSKAFDMVMQPPKLLLFDDNKIKMARKPGKKQKEIPVGCIGEGER